MPYGAGRVFFCRACFLKANCGRFCSGLVFFSRSKGWEAFKNLTWDSDLPNQVKQFHFLVTPWGRLNRGVVEVPSSETLGFKSTLCLGPWAKGGG